MPYFWYVPRTVGCAVVVLPDDDIWISSQQIPNCYQIITIDICSRNIDFMLQKTILSTQTRLYLPSTGVVVGNAVVVSSKTQI